MDELRVRLKAAGFGDVRLVIINAGSSAHAGLALQAAARAVPVLQDNDILSPSIWELMGAAKDDIMVFDRCGHLTYHVIMPWSLLTYPYVKAAVLSTYHDKPCGPCNRTSVSHHHDQHQANGESEQSAVNASYAEQLLLSQHMIQQTVSPIITNTSDVPDEPLETSIMAPPTQNNDSNYQEAMTLSNLDINTEQGDNKYQETTTAASSGEYGDVDDLPLRVIIRYPHSHQDNKGIVRKHETLVMRTGDADYHGHLDEEVVTQEPESLAPVDTQRNAIRRNNGSHSAVDRMDILFRDYPLWRNTWLNRSSGVENGTVQVDNTVRARVGGADETNGEENQNGEEGEDDESQDIKQKMIEHYKKLLPWINYTL
ncbi:hypothetical protein J437_LFUL014109 [Ladona fulva]|uniref:Selenoprotein P N-terminal domain-containing protein n=1 Tax=Ladona fulva TaxID=123851 RepID=A0A8K0KET8_LADFU|nr:hypothetical protein J437_LFUL014109 [Ladona fulva]